MLAVMMASTRQETLSCSGFLALPLVNFAQWAFVGIATKLTFREHADACDNPCVAKPGFVFQKQRHPIIE